MAHLFSPIHRKAKSRSAGDALYHGNYCETQYLLGMRLSARAKELRTLIKFKRSSMETLRKQIGYSANKETFWDDVREARNDSRKVSDVRIELAQVEYQLAQVKQNYKFAYLIQHIKKFCKDKDIKIVTPDSSKFEHVRNRISTELMWELKSQGITQIEIERRTDSMISIVMDLDSKPVGTMNTIKSRENADRLAQYAQNEMGKHMNFPFTTTVRMKGKP